jgi:hypothetical protein
MPFQLGWTNKPKQNKPEEEYISFSSAENTLFVLINTLRTEISEMRTEFTGIALRLEKILQAPESPTLSLINEEEAIQTLAREAAGHPWTLPAKYDSPEIVKEKEGYLYTQKVINSRKDPLIVAHIKSCGLIRSKKAWKRHPSPESVIRWAKKFDDIKWSKQVVIAVCAACLPFKDQHQIYGRQIPPFWNNNTIERQKSFQQEGYTPKYLYP